MQLEAEGKQSVQTEEQKAAAEAALLVKAGGDPTTNPNPLIEAAVKKAKQVWSLHSANLPS